MKADDFFTPEEKDTIAATIRDVEKNTAGEVAVMVVDTSDTYPESPLLAGVVLGALAALLVTDLFFNDSLWVFIPLTACSALFFNWLTNKIPMLKRFFIATGRIEEEVEQRAIQAFYEKGLYKTRDKSGVLILLSLLEHKVWILADKGIYSKIPRETLDSHAGAIARGIKDKQAAQALCREISGIGTILSTHFPVREDDTNELPDQVLSS